MEPDPAQRLSAVPAQPPFARPAYLPERIIDRIEGQGPILICVGGVHGNEPGGVLALERVCRSLRRDGESLAGTLVALRGNRPALMAGERALERDLNRAWQTPGLQRLAEQDPTEDDLTDQEMRDLWRILEEQRASGRSLFLLDLHSTSGDGPPFAVVLGKERCQRLASEVGIPCVHGLNESIRGTLASWFALEAGASIVVEGGRSGESSTVRHLEAAIYSVLGASGLLPKHHERVQHGRQILQQASDELPRHVRVFYREAIGDLDFQMGRISGRRFQSFDPVRQGDLLGQNRLGVVRAARDGYLIMPLYQKQGGEGFFLAEPCADPSRCDS